MKSANWSIEKDLNMGNMRELSSQEWELVSGGEITVTGGGRRDNFDWGAYHWWNFGGGNDDQGEDYGNGQGNDDVIDEPTSPDKMTDAEKEKLTTTLEGLKAILEENIKKYGDAQLQLPDGTKVMASDVLDALGKTLDLLDAAVIAWDVLNNNADAIEVAGFLAGVAGGAVAGVLGAGPIAVFLASTGATIATKAGLEFFDQQWDKAWEEAFVAVSDPGGNQTENMVKFFRDLFGSPSNPFNDNPFDGDPFGYYNGPGYKNWIA